MKTIQLQCGQCKNVMAISEEHLGQQVQCPHCRSVVQTPAPESAATTVALSGAVGGSTAAPDATEAIPSDGGMPPPRHDTTPAPNDQPSHSAAEFAEFKPKARKDRGLLLLMALIFLIPYALTMTFFVIWLLVVRPGSTDGLEYLRDPAPNQKQGGPRPARGKRPPHDLPVAEHRKGPLGKTIKAGDIEVTPLRVLVTSDGDLKLLLRAKNVSAKTAFEPMNVLYVNEKKSPDKLYTFLESRSKSIDNIYGGDLEYHRSREAKDAPVGFAVLGPSEEVTIAIITHERYRQGAVSSIVKSGSDEFTWRVQLRRGLVKVDGKDISATTVIGVDFSSKDIEKGAKG